MKNFEDKSNELAKELRNQLLAMSAQHSKDLDYIRELEFRIYELRVELKKAQDNLK